MDGDLANHGEAAAYRIAIQLFRASKYKRITFSFFNQFFQPKGLGMKTLPYLIFLPSIVVGQLFSTTLGCSALQAQSVKNAVAVEEESSNGFDVVTAISLGPTGFQTTVQCSLTDELGFKYDTWSILAEPSVRTQTALTPEQWGEIGSLKREFEQMLATETLGLVTNEDTRTMLKERFTAVNAEMKNVLTPEQLAVVEAAKLQLPLQRFGVNQVLATQQMRDELGLGEEELKQISESETHAKSKLAMEIEAKIRSANERMLAELNYDQVERFQQLLDEAARESFLTSELIGDSKTRRPRSVALGKSLLRFVKRSAIQRKLDLTSQQKERLSAIETNSITIAEAFNSIGDVLSAEQLAKCKRLAIAEQVKQYGSVVALAYGYLAAELSLTEEEADQVAGRGRELAEELGKEIVALKRESIHSVLAVLPEDKAERFRQALETMSR